MQPTDIVLDPATGKPALDNFGNQFTYNAAWYYTNKAVWQTDETVKELAAQVAALKADLSATIGKSVADYLRENPPTVEAVDYDALAARVVAEFKKEGN